MHNIQLLKAFWGRQAALVAMKMKSRSKLNMEDNLICALSCINHWVSMLSNNKQVWLSCWLWRTLCYWMLFSVVCISALCLGNSCCIGEFLQLVGHGPSVLVIGLHASKKLRTPSLMPLLLYSLLKDVMLVLSKLPIVTYTRH